MRSGNGAVLKSSPGSGVPDAIDEEVASEEAAVESASDDLRRSVEAIFNAKARHASIESRALAPRPEIVDQMLYCHGPGGSHFIAKSS